jgi:alpha-beta hydrolase superfamily lysophospholipase
LFYQPDHYLYAPPEKLNLKYENIYFESLDKVRLHAWFFPAQKLKKLNHEKNLILLFHGNAQNLSSHYLSVSWMTQYGFDVLVWDYRGYGLSQGEPESEGIYKDAQAALNLATKKFKEGNYKNFFVLGQSLGGNILLNALTDFPDRWPISVVTIDSSFGSYQSMAKDRLQTFWLTYPFSFLSPLLISDEYAPLKKLDRVKLPALVMHSDQDKVVPSHFGREIYKFLGSPHKKYWTIQKAPHIGTLGNGDPKTEEKYLQYLKELLAPQ